MADKLTTGAWSAAKFAFGLSFEADTRRTLTAGAFQVVGALAAVGTVLIGKLLLDELVSDTPSVASVLVPLLVLALVTAVMGTIGAVRAQQERLLGELVTQTVWRRVLDVVTGVDLLTYEQQGFVTEFTNVEQAGMVRPQRMTRSAFDLIGSGLAVAAMFVAIVTLAPILVPLLVLGGVPAVLLSRRASRVEFLFARRATPSYLRREYLRRVLTQRENAGEIRSFDAVPFLRNKHRELDRIFEDDLTTHVRQRTWLALAQIAGTTASLVLALVAIVVLLDTGRLTLAEAGASALAARILGGQLNSVYGAYSGLTESAPFIRDLTRFLNWPSTPVTSESAPALTTSIQLTDVGFRYPSRDVDALRGIDLQIRPGEVVAVVGENGSGKSTLANVVSGLFEPTTGTVEWDGRKLPPNVLRAGVTMVMQDFGRYCFDVTDNIALAGGGDLDTAGVVDAATSARLAETVDRLPSGYDTILGRELDEGLDLSGGQWQRVALARALYKNSPVVVLDEPSAALDPRAESELFDDVRRVLNGRAALLISHRFANVLNADHIYVLHEGELLEHGTHRSLMALRGKYHELYTLQSAAYERAGNE